MKNLIREMPGSVDKDIPRLIARVEELIAENKIRNYKSFAPTKDKVELTEEGEEKGKQKKKIKGAKARTIDLEEDSSY